MTKKDPFHSIRCKLSDLKEDIEYKRRKLTSQTLKNYAALAAYEPTCDELEYEFVEALDHARRFARTPGAVDSVTGETHATLRVGAIRRAKHIALEAASRRTPDGDVRIVEVMMAEVLMREGVAEDCWTPEMVFAAEDAQHELWEEENEQHYERQKADAIAKGEPAPERPTKSLDLPNFSNAEIIAQVKRGSAFADNLIKVARKAGIKPTAPKISLRH